MASVVSSETWQFELYIIGDSRRSALAVENLRDICKDYLQGHCCVNVFDIKERPELAAKMQITAAPYLIKKYPLPERKLVGDLSVKDKVLESLDLDHPAKTRDMGKTYSEGLNRQGLRFKMHHERH